MQNLPHYSSLSLVDVSWQDLDVTIISNTDLCSYDCVNVHKNILKFFPFTFSFPLPFFSLKLFLSFTSLSFSLSLLPKNAHIQCRIYYVLLTEPAVSSKHALWGQSLNCAEYSSSVLSPASNPWAIPSLYVGLSSLFSISGHCQDFHFAFRNSFWFLDSSYLPILELLQPVYTLLPNQQCLPTGNFCLTLGTCWTKN